MICMHKVEANADSEAKHRLTNSELVDQVTTLYADSSELYITLTNFCSLRSFFAGHGTSASLSVLTFSNVAV